MKVSLGYSLNSKAFRIYNKRTMTIEESIHVAFDETNSVRPRKDIHGDITDTLEDIHIHEKVHKDKEDRNSRDFQSKEKQINVDLSKEWRTSRYHPLHNIIGDISKGVTTRYSLKDACNNMAFVSLVEPKNINEP